MHVGTYLGLVHHSEQELAKAFVIIAERHADEPDIDEICRLLSSWSCENVELLKPLIERYSEDISDEEPEALTKMLFKKPRSGSLALLRDLHDLWLLASEAHVSWSVLQQAAIALRDRDFITTCKHCSNQNKRQISWLINRIKQAAPQTLIVAA